METKNLEQLRSLRTQEKAIKARIDEISPKAADEAVAILAEKGQDLTLPTTTSTSKNKPSNGVRMPKKRSKSRTSSRLVPPS